MRGLTRRGAGSIGLCLMLAAGAAGCTEAAADPPPTTPSPTVTEVEPSPTPTPTPTPVAPESVEPERPTAMDVVDEEGAAAVAAYFLELYPYVYATGDLEEWKALSHPECIFCASVVTNVEAERVAGGRSEGGLLSINSEDSIEIRPGFFSVTIEATQTAGISYAADGSVVDRAEASASVLTFVILEEGAGWSVREVQADPVAPQ